MTKPYPTHLHTFISQKSTEPGEHWKRDTCRANEFELLEAWYTPFFYKNIFYKNIEAEICKILRIF